MVLGLYGHSLRDDVGVIRHATLSASPTYVRELKNSDRLSCYTAKLVTDFLLKLTADKYPQKPDSDRDAAHQSSFWQSVG
jgi:hypothetical protein